jgi:hypothetical protein
VDILDRFTRYLSINLDVNDNADLGRHFMTCVKTFSLRDSRKCLKVRTELAGNDPGINLSSSGPLTNVVDTF